MTTPAAVHRRLSRGRRSARLSGDQRELAILATAEQLLMDRSLADISVDDLAHGAGISRSTFYFYFPSKDAVLLTLLEQAVTEADTALAEVVEKSRSDGDNMWRAGINVFFETFGAHKGAVRAAWAVRATNAEASELWSTFMQKWTAHTAAVIEAERAKGAAPETLSAHALATALNLLNERVLSATFTAEQPFIPESEVLDALLHMWVTTIYGAAG